jgi:formate hydrogenlyase subunit 4
MIMFKLSVVIVPLLAAPLLSGIINKVKAFYAGRQGQSIMQPWYDIIKLLKKDFIYSKTSTWIIRTTPAVLLSCVLTALFFTPMGNFPSLLSFKGDIFVIVCFLGLSRFFIIISALDTGSSFEGMGASREAWISALAEPALFMSLVALARMTGEWSLSGIVLNIPASKWQIYTPYLIMIVTGLFIITLAENSRIPFDDQNTHLELTMIHEVMILDNAGPDLGLILYASSLKLWLFCSILVGLIGNIIPLETLTSFAFAAGYAAGMIAAAVLIGTVESITARVRLLRISQLLVGACLLPIITLFLLLR